ncbi:hypothetical protein VB10N_19790 [Vibrio sp. 10N]|nr:hypothetical protein VB10N_19790 [Vibrio sp. 10N]
MMNPDHRVSIENKVFCFCDKATSMYTPYSDKRVSRATKTNSDNHNHNQYHWPRLSKQAIHVPLTNNIINNAITLSFHEQQKPFIDRYRL